MCVKEMVSNKSKQEIRRTVRVDPHLQFRDLIIINIIISLTAVFMCICMQSCMHTAIYSFSLSSAYFYFVFFYLDELSQRLNPKLMITVLKKKQQERVCWKKKLMLGGVCVCVCVCVCVFSRDKQTSVLKVFD